MGISNTQRPMTLRAGLWSVVYWMVNWKMSGMFFCFKLRNQVREIIMIVCFSQVEQCFVFHIISWDDFRPLQLTLDLEWCDVMPATLNDPEVYNITSTMSNSTFYGDGNILNVLVEYLSPVYIYSSIILMYYLYTYTRWEWIEQVPMKKICRQWWVVKRQLICLIHFTELLVQQCSVYLSAAAYSTSVFTHFPSLHFPSLISCNAAHGWHSTKLVQASLYSSCICL